MTELRKRLIIIMIYLLPFIVTVVSVIFQKTGILSGGVGSPICFIGELIALLFFYIGVPVSRKVSRRWN